MPATVWNWMSCNKRNNLSMDAVEPGTGNRPRFYFVAASGGFH